MGTAKDQMLEEMDKVKHRKYKDFAGPVLYGHDEMQKPDQSDPFLEKLVYLTAKVESGGYFGSVFMADGTGITAGLCQHVSVLPKQMRWGDLWKLVAFIDCFFPVAYYDLGELLLEQDWEFQPDGVLRDDTNQVAVPPGVFRNTVTPTQGVVPEEGPAWRTAKLWCLAVHQLFSHPNTQRAQVLYECRHFQKMIERTHFRGVLGGKMVSTLAFPTGVTRSMPFEDPHVELAMLVFLSFAVNAPKWAYQALERAIRSHGIGEGFVPTTDCMPGRAKLFAAALIKELEQVGGSKWDDDREYGRYQRTRKVLLTMFDQGVVSDVMPADIPEYDGDAYHL